MQSPRPAVNPESESLDRPNALFVYGTLAPGHINEHILAPLLGTWTDEQISGSLHDAGLGATYRCPGLRLENSTIDHMDLSRGNCSVVNGLLFESNELRKIWARLDELEGQEYQPQLTIALVAGNKYCRCIVYELVDTSPVRN